ncbi:MAG: ribbon-helix-helix protein, CopG family [Bryobacteraceae bacterium]
MKSTVQARLDRETHKALTQLVRRLGWSPSKVVREALQLLAVCQGGYTAKKIVGLGSFASGIPDLGSNKSRLEGFGR